MKAFICKLFGHKTEWVTWKQNNVPTRLKDKSHPLKYSRQVCKRCGAVFKDKNDLFDW